MKRPAVRYHGGKWMLGPWIIEHFPEHTVYVEPYGGGGSVLMRKPRSHAEVYNDKWSGIVNVFRVLREHPCELERLTTLTPFSREEFELCGQDSNDDIENARRTIFRSMSGFGSASSSAKHNTGFRASSNRSGTTPAHDWQNYPKHIADFAERFRGVVLENREAIDVMTQHDSLETLHYVDPPYLHETRSKGKYTNVYEYEMTDWQHLCLIEFLKTLDGCVVLSGYRSIMYDRLLTGWLRVDKNAFADGANHRIESLWLNELAQKTGQMSLF